MKSKQPTMYKRGFTLIELIVVVMLIGILAVSVGTRFIGKDGLVELTYQSRLIAALRAMQTRAMYDTRPGYCFKINISPSPAAFGPPTLSYGDADPSATCSNVIDYTSSQHLGTTSSELAENKIEIVSQLDGASPFSYIGFDNLGRPLTSAAGGTGKCAAGCKIVFKSKQRASVCVAAQGYIYACQ